MTSDISQEIANGRPQRNRRLIRLSGVGFIALALTACQQAPIPFKDRPPLPANLTSPCPDLTPLEDGTGASVLRKLVELSSKYYDCQARHAALVKAVSP